MSISISRHTGVTWYHRKSICFIIRFISSCFTSIIYILTLFFFFTEPWIRRSSRTSGELENSISYGSHDGARPSNHHACQTGCLRFHTEHHVGAQIFHALQVVRRAAFQAGALRFRAA